MSRGPEIVRDNESTEAGWQLETTVVWIAHWFGLSLDEHECKDTKHCCEPGHAGLPVEKLHRESLLSCRTLMSYQHIALVDQDDSVRVATELESGMLQMRSDPKSRVPDPESRVPSPELQGAFCMA
jgi:hypothetical protein